MKIEAEEKWHFKHAEDMESDEEVASRAIEALTEIANNHPDSVVLVGAHGSLLRTTLIKLGFYEIGALRGGAIENAAFAELIYKDGKFSLGDHEGIHPHPASV